MPLRQMGEAVDLRAAIPNLKQRLGPNAYDAALRERLQATKGLGEQATQFSEEQALKRQRDAYAKRLSELQNRQVPSAAAGGGSSQMVKGGDGKYYSILGGVNAPVTFGYGAKYKQAHSGLTSHHGVDLGAKSGTAFYAPTGGVIEALLDTGNKGFGKNVRVKFDNGSYGIFGHLSSWLGNLKVGSKFTGGSQLGYTGNSGDSSGDHLHFETRWNLYDPGTSFDPSSWFGW